MIHRRAALICLALIALNANWAAAAAEVILPQDRMAFYAKESIEIAVAGLKKGEKAAIEIAPKDAASKPVKFEVTGDGGTVTTVLPPHALAPGKYALKMDGKDVVGVELTIASGVINSPMMLSHLNIPPEQCGGNFVVASLAGTGCVEGDGKPTRFPRRGVIAPHTYAAFGQIIARNMPSNVFTYWTGYLTHKPWGSNKSWENEAMDDAMRHFSFRAAQVLRRFAGNVYVIGTIDQPALGMGRNASGVLAPFLANWDSEKWYSDRGVKLTPNPAGGSDADWMKYVNVRAGVLGECMMRARRDMETVWPEAPFSTDFYFVSALCDGMDAMNQASNKTPYTHVFLDGGVPRAAAGSEIYIEKSHDPTAPVSHIMNVRMFGEPVSKEQIVVTNHLMMNAMLQCGIYSNWWLGTDNMQAEDYVAVHEPVIRLGGLFREMSPRQHDVAVLWSRTELGMRCKGVASQQAGAQANSPIPMLTISEMRENEAIKSGRVELSTYAIGGNYRNQISHAHAAVMRAGYAAHVVHESVLDKLLKDYKVLVIVGQTFPLPKETMKTIEDWQAAGGRIVVDSTTTQRFGDAIVADVDLKDSGYRCEVMFAQSRSIRVRQSGSYENNSNLASVREASQYQTNWFMGSFTRNAVGPMKAAIAKTKASPIMETDQVNLIAERHVAGMGMLYMVLNANDVLPEIPEEQKHKIYNYAPMKATFTLKGIPKDSQVWCIEGVDWKNVSQVNDCDTPITADFAAGEMKLYLVMPGTARNLEASAQVVESCMEVSADLDAKAPLPLTITVVDPDGKELYKVYRSLNALGKYTEKFAIGSNAKTGSYGVTVASILGERKLVAEVKPVVALPAQMNDAVRVFDEKLMQGFLATKPAVTVAVSGENYKVLAEQLAKGLNEGGIKAVVADEKTVYKKALYPRVWDPYVRVFKPEGTLRKPAGEVKTKIVVELDDEGVCAKTEDGQPAKTPDGDDVGEDWKRAFTYVTVGPRGLLLWEGRDGETYYEPGCVLYVDKNRSIQVLKGGRPFHVKSTPEFKAKVSRPWKSLSAYYGGYSLPPELPEAYDVKDHLILLGDSTKGDLVAALQASELLPQVADAKYPGPGKALLQMAWSPFAVEKNVLFVGASDEEGVKAGVAKLVDMARQGGPRR